MAQPSVPARGVHLQPARGIVGVLYAGGVGRLAAEGEIDGDDQQAAGRERAIFC